MSWDNSGLVRTEALARCWVEGKPPRLNDREKGVGRPAPFSAFGRSTLQFMKLCPEARRSIVAGLKKARMEKSARFIGKLLVLLLASNFLQASQARIRFRCSLFEQSELWI